MAKSLVLLKNNGVLPLRKSARIAVIGPLGDDQLAAELSPAFAAAAVAVLMLLLRRRPGH